ncbi:hypothetical protein Taro_046435, partial [Colocasia esculenta]|nr:hypothetical protein [Colocasia esculenta]
MVPAMDTLLSMDNAVGQPPVRPHDPDWLLPLGAILVALFALGCIMVFIILRWGSCREHRVGSCLFEHECMVVSLGTTLFFVLSLASFYYLFCYRGGCYGTALDVGAPPAIAGRKLAKMKLRELLLALGSLRGHGFLPETPPTVLPPPHDHDWIIPLAFMVVGVVSMLSLFSYLAFRCSKCRVDPAGGSDPEVLRMDHECAIACLVLVLFTVCSLASLYYYYCFRAGCFGTGGGPPVAKLMAPPVAAGRKFLMMA